MNSSEFILGLSSFSHDSAAALIGEQGFTVAIEEEKLERVRNTTGIPHAAIQYCLDRAGISWRDLAGVAVANRPLRAWARNAWLRVRQTPIAPVSSGYYQSKALGELGRELNYKRKLHEMDQSATVTVETLEHHLCHAASAYYASDADSALILTLDEMGDGISGMLALGEGPQIRVLRQAVFPNSVGWVFSQVTALLGFTPNRDEHKTQWLALAGEPEFKDIFLKMSGQTRFSS